MAIGRSRVFARAIGRARSTARRRRGTDARAGVAMRRARRDASRCVASRGSDGGRRAMACADGHRRDRWGGWVGGHPRDDDDDDDDDD